MGFTFTVQWCRGSTVIPDATADTYTCTAADTGQRISCAVTASNGATSTTARSAPTPPVTAAAGTYATTYPGIYQ